MQRYLIPPATTVSQSFVDAAYKVETDTSSASKLTRHCMLFQKEAQHFTPPVAYSAALPLHGMAAILLKLMLAKHDA